MERMAAGTMRNLSNGYAAVINRVINRVVHTAERRHLFTFMCLFRPDDRCGLKKMWVQSGANSD